MSALAVNAPLLAVENLHVEFSGRAGHNTHAVRGVDFRIDSGDIVGLVGESGCGKSVTARIVMALQNDITAQVTAGSVSFRGQDLLQMEESELRSIRGNEIAMIFQDPMSALDPLFTIGWQIGETIRLHQPKLTKREVRGQVLALLSEVGIADPEDGYGRYPHEFSGGMQQRVMIATALANRPALLIADEPTTALDVTVQAQILRLLRRLRDRTGLAILLITHDLGVVAEIADRILVMYAGRIVERASVEELFDNPGHPYTAALMDSRPSASEGNKHLAVIPGYPPPPSAEMEGCRFRDRCWLTRGRVECETTEPELAGLGPDHASACHFASEVSSERTADISAGGSLEQTATER